MIGMMRYKSRITKSMCKSSRRIFVTVGILGLAACSDQEGRGLLGFQVTEVGQRAAWPELLPLSSFEEAALGEDARLSTLTGAARTLALRAARLRSKAKLLQAPILTADERRTLQSAVARR